MIIVLALTTLLLSSGPGTLAAAAQPAHTQDGGSGPDLDHWIASAPRLAQEDPNSLWSAATAIVRRADKSPEDLGALTRDLDDRLARVSEHMALESEPAAELLLIASRLQCPEPDTGALALRLADHIDTERGELGRSVASLAGNRVFRLLGGAPATRLYEALSEAMSASDRSPGERLAAAAALFRIGSGAERRAARTEMKLFLRSSDARLRNLGALALASCGDTDTGLDELERMAELPGEDGKLAAAYLEQEEIRRYFARRIKDLDARAKERKEAEKEGSIKELDQVEEVLQKIEAFHLIGDQRSRDRLVEEALDGMLRSLGQVSRFVPPADVEALEHPGSSSENGIGCGLAVDPSDGLLTVMHVNQGSSGEAAGLRSDDKIVRIDAWPTLRNPLDECLAHLSPTGPDARGSIGTRQIGTRQVDLYIWRRGMEYETLDRPREDMIHRVELRLGQPRPIVSVILPEHIGLLEVREPRDGFDSDVAERWVALRKSGAGALVLDLRRARGGAVELGVDLADLFLPTGTLVATLESRVEETVRLYTKSPAVVQADVPLVILIDRFTSGAAEVAAAILQETGRARLVGERSYGDGSVHRAVRIPGEIDDIFDDLDGDGAYDPGEPLVRDLNGNGRFDPAPRVMLPIARVVLPSGRSIRRETDEEGEVVTVGGLTPDVVSFPRSYAPWQVEEITRVDRSGLIEAYLDGKFADVPELLTEVYQDDSGRIEGYAGFEELYPQLATLLARQDVYALIRAALRRRVQSVQARDLVQGDWLTDHQIQRALATLCEDRGQDWEELPAFARVFGIDHETRAAGRLLAQSLSPETRADLEGFLAQIEEGLVDGVQLTTQDLERLQTILSKALGQSGSQR